ncbi:UDP-N-acetylmuramate--L-alanine ligase [bacterium]|nr:UDP-N-acetylmuramate--L-alanine ligase [bacterium]
MVVNYLNRKMPHIHLVGIAGTGVSGIAEILKTQGFHITGSDLTKTPITDRLEELGCIVYRGHKAEHVGQANALVYSSAVTEDNPEVVEARRLGIPVIRRAEMLAELMRMKTGIAVAGVHGKTTTTSLIGDLLAFAELDPTVIVGGVVRGMGTNARLGYSDLLVAEADEFDRSFLKLAPIIALLTTLEEEHTDTYDTYEKLRDAFLHFANSVPFYGLIVLCSDEPNLVELLPDIHRPVLTYGFNPQADIRGEAIEIGEISSMDVIVKGEKLGRLEIPLTGRHNLLNALGAFTIAREMEVPFDKITAAFKQFRGVRRRFEKIGEVNDVVVYDDFAHHPTEVMKTLEAARETFNRRIVAVFQPHLFTRTQKFYKDFARVFLAADIVILTDIYPSREQPIEGVTTELIFNEAKRMGHKHVEYIPERVSVAPRLKEITTYGDVLIVIGAGDVYKISEEFLTAG